MEKTYLAKLDTLARDCATLPKTRMMALARIDVMVRMNLAIDQLMFDQALPDHPFTLTDRILSNAIDDIGGWKALGFADGGEPIGDHHAPDAMEDMHQELFQILWTQFSPEEYQGRIDRFRHRLVVNDLDKGFLNDMRCIDFGCGHGNFAHALVQCGAEYALGVDFGSDSIRYARQARDRLQVPAEMVDFREATVYASGAEDNSFDLALQNGVFHHVDDEDAAYREMHRVVKPGGWIWAYSEGSHSIARDVFAVSVRILEDVPSKLVTDHLAHIGLNTNKRYHMSDGLNAVYRATTWDELTGRLAEIGFGNFRRLKGGFDTDLDIDPDHPFSAEKFGEGDLRLLAQKL